MYVCMYIYIYIYICNPPGLRPAMPSTQRAVREAGGPDGRVRGDIMLHPSIS